MGIEEKDCMDRKVMQCVAGFVCITIDRVANQTS